MQIPNADRAHVETAKMTEYLLNLGHPTGGGKARVFLRYGYRRGRPEDLTADLIKLAQTEEADHIGDTRHGTKWVIVGLLNTPTGEHLRVLTVWQIDRGSDRPRFITARPLEGGPDD